MSITKLLRSTIAAVSYLVLLAAAVFVLGSFFTIPGGYKLYTVLTGSMEPTIPTGSLIVTRIPEETNTITPDTIITFEHPTTPDTLITHRVAAVEKNTFITQGDANPEPDNWAVPFKNVRGSYLTHTPYAGYILEFIKSPLGLIFFILIPALLIAAGEIRNIVNVLVEKKLMRFAQQHGFNDINELLQQFNFLKRMRRSKQPAVDSIHKPKKKPFHKSVQDIATRPLTILVVSGLTMTSIPASWALLTGNMVTLNGNSVSTAAVFSFPTPSPSPTPTPTPSPDVAGACDTSINVDQRNIDTGEGSTNTNNINVDHECTTTVKNTATVTNDIDVTANTGGNTSTDNTESGNITSGDVSIDFSVTNEVNNN